MRLDKYLAEAGAGTRSQVKDYIRKGLVTVNEKQAKDGSVHINENNDRVCLKGKRLDYAKERYYMLYKPKGVVCANKDNVNKTVLELFDKKLQRGLIIVGRLDKDTEGLLLLTTNGSFSHQLMSPVKHVTKTYYFEADGVLTKEDIEKLEAGVSIGCDEPLTLPAKVSHVSGRENTVCGRLTIMEGRFHQVKRMLLAVGCRVTYLKRISIGAILLDESLKPGEYRELSEKELQAVGYCK